jgi:hypothetical protein
MHGSEHAATIISRLLTIDNVKYILTWLESDFLRTITFVPRRVYKELAVAGNK